MPELMRVQSNEHNLSQKVEELLVENKDKRIVIVGTTSSGKSTLLRSLKSRGVAAHDMDELVFPKLTPQEEAEVTRTPWTPDIGRRMKELAKKYVQIKQGEPVFGTIVFDADLIVYIHIADSLLRKRSESRNVSFDDAKNMQRQIEDEIKSSSLPVIEVLV